MSVKDIQIESSSDFDLFKGAADFGIIGIVDTSKEEEQQCMSEDMLDALKNEFDQGKYMVEGFKIKIGRMDVSKEQVRQVAKEVGLRVDQGQDMREP